MAAKKKKVTEDTTKVEFPIFVTLDEATALGNDSKLGGKGKISGTQATNNAKYILESEVSVMISASALALLEAVLVSIEDLMQEIEQTQEQHPEIPKAAVVGGQSFGMAMMLHIRRAMNDLNLEVRMKGK